MDFTPKTNYIEHQIFMRSTDGGHRVAVPAVVDSGSPYMVIPRTVAQKLKLDISPAGKTLDAQGVGGQVNRVPIYKGLLGAWTRDEGFVTVEVEILVVDGAPLTLLGLGVLDKFTWAIGDRQLHLIRRKSSQDMKDGHG